MHDTPAEEYKALLVFDKDAHIEDSCTGRIAVIGEGVQEIFVTSIEACREYVTEFNAKLKSQSDAQEQALAPYQ